MSETPAVAEPPALHVETFHSLDDGMPILVPCDCFLGEDHTTSPGGIRTPLRRA
jgi:hypothetical protein